MILGIWFCWQDELLMIIQKTMKKYQCSITVSLSEKRCGVFLHDSTSMNSIPGSSYVWRMKRVAVFVWVILILCMANGIMPVSGADDSRT
ncbi:MAG: hypothetical protein CVV33_01560, partial [Methanomicrobiales archaeon HGW-Methanomicrobiales-4]